MVFSVAVGWALAHGLDISCGCGGGNTMVTWWKGLEFTGYLVGFGFLWWMEGKGDGRIPKGFGV